MKAFDTTTSLDYFASLVAPESEILLFEAALAIAHDVRPALDMSAFHAEMDQIGEQLQQIVPRHADPETKYWLMHLLFHMDLGFGVDMDDFYAAKACYLDHVLQARRGIPVTLALLMMELGHEIGLHLEGICFPGHFLLKLHLPQREMIIDPVTGCDVKREQLEQLLTLHLLEQDIAPGNPVLGGQNMSCDLAQHLRSASQREILLWLMKILRCTYITTYDWQGLLAIAQKFLILEPDNPQWKRDRGLAYANLGFPREAIADFATYLQARPDARDAAQIRLHLPRLQRSIN